MIRLSTLILASLAKALYHLSGRRTGDDSKMVKALAWRIVTRFLMLPGFRSLERWRYARREEIADRITAGIAVERYRDLLVRAARKQQSSLLSWRLDALRGTRSEAISLWPAIVAFALLIGMIASHFVFLGNATYLMTHHC